MTRDEAIAHGKEQLDVFGGEHAEFIKLAIKALEQECEDAVSRRAVLDIVRFEENWLSDAKSNNADTDIAFSGIRTQVAKLPPVTKALEPCEDCISREAVKNILPRQKFISYEAYLSCVADVDKLPSVTPAQKLEQESILDKIRADVSARYPKNYAGEPELGGSACEFSLNQILQIIDKYKAEMEEEE